MTKPLTGRQETLLLFLKDHVRAGKPMPTIREIGVRLGIRSPNGVSNHLKALERKGAITRDRNKARSIQIVGAEPSVVPAWHPRPTCPGVWVWPHPEVEGWMLGMTLTQSDIERGVPFREVSVFGPIPACEVKP